MSWEIGWTTSRISCLIECIQNSPGDYQTTKELHIHWIHIWGPTVPRIMSLTVPQSLHSRFQDSGWYSMSIRVDPLQSMDLIVSVGPLRVWLSWVLPSNTNLFVIILWHVTFSIVHHCNFLPISEIKIRKTISGSFNMALSHTRLKYYIQYILQM